MAIREVGLGRDVVRAVGGVGQGQEHVAIPANILLAISRSATRDSDIRHTTAHELERTHMGVFNQRGMSKIQCCPLSRQNLGICHHGGSHWGSVFGDSHRKLHGLFIVRRNSGLDGHRGIVTTIIGPGPLYIRSPLHHGDAASAAHERCGLINIFNVKQLALRLKPIRQHLGVVRHRVRVAGDSSWRKCSHGSSSRIRSHRTDLA